MPRRKGRSLAEVGRAYWVRRIRQAVHEEPILLPLDPCTPVDTIFEALVELGLESDSWAVCLVADGNKKAFSLQIDNSKVVPWPKH